MTSPRCAEDMTPEEFLARIENFDYLGYLAKKKLRRERPWVLDIIRVLWPRRWGLRIADVEDERPALRNPQLAEGTPKVPEPKKFRQTIQSALNYHTSPVQGFPETKSTAGR